ncbi:MAG: DUF2752 domain-containing protein [Melioribacteraceae bacterium]|nr:DUF2752 domain-containing protein [Melioribacteraceae bacterium]
MKTFLENTAKLIYKNLEAFIWLAGLIYLASINPYATDHFNFCVFSLVGFESCPGCGLGRSISFLFRGDIAASFDSHMLGIPALLILSYRIVSVFYKNYKTTHKPLEVYNG